MVRPLRSCALAALLLLACASAGGCTALGYVAAVVPGPPMKARYPGLAGQRVAIMTWADRAAVFNYQTFGSDVQRDVSMAVQNRLALMAKPEAKTEELAGTYFVDARQVHRWQKNHPELDGRPLSEIAPRVAAALGVTRIVYVELQPFLTRDPRTEILLKGYTVASVKVAEVTNGAVTIPYEETGVEITFPEKAPEGIPPSESVDETYVYRGLVGAVGSQLALRFMSYQEQ